MSQKPLTDFFMKMGSYHPHDVAVLFALMACSELLTNARDVIPPAVKNRIWALDMDPSELENSLKKLVECGELRWVENELFRGYQVVRLKEFQDSLKAVGRRNYQSEYQRARRAPEKIEA